MRYWIYWSDLVQGPFELEELFTLKAFRADLMVCEEGREEWSPAAAIPELAQHFVTVAPMPMGAVPPPPPPTHPPSLTPLQGEFFNESQAQQPLFDLNGSKNYAFRPAEESPATFPEDVPTHVTTPFRFAVIIPPWLKPSTELPPLPTIPEPVKELKPASYPIVEEQPVRYEIVPAWTEEPLPEIAVDRVENPIVIETPVEAPPVLTPIPEVTPPSLHILLEIPKPEVPKPPPVSPPVTKEPVPSRTPHVERRIPRVSIATSKAPLLDEIRPAIPTPRLWPWVLAAMATLSLIVGALFMRMARTSSHPTGDVNVSPLVFPSVTTPPVETPLVPIQPVLSPTEKPATSHPLPSKRVQPVVRKRVPKPIPVKKGFVPVEISPPPSVTATPPARGIDWQGKEQQAIAVALQQKIYSGQRTVGTNATLMMEDMHEKELVHAADTGERLYMPDKVSWSALQEEGPRYRVYLNFMAWQLSGERTQAQSNQFLVNLDKNTVTAADDGTRQNFFDETKKLQHQHSAKAADVESLLSAVDVVNRQKMRAVILQTTKDKNEKKNIQNALQLADSKLQRMVVYFRTKYAEVTLQNIAKAYMFTGLLKGK